MSAGLYKQLAEKAICDIWRRGKVPILVGGTGLYFSALYYGLFEGPPADPEKRLFYSRLSLQELLKRVEECDPLWLEQNRTHDRRRLTRVLEVWELTGKRMSELQSKNRRLDVEWRVLAPHWPRSILYERINHRVLGMLNAGLVEETQAIRNRWGNDAPALATLGYKQVGDYLDGKCDYATMVASIQQETRRYAKRQITWFRKNSAVEWVSPEEWPGVQEKLVRWALEQERGGEISYTEGSVWP